MEGVVAYLDSKRSVFVGRKAGDDGRYIQFIGATGERTRLLLSAEAADALGAARELLDQGAFEERVRGRRDQRPVHRAVHGA